MSSEVKNAVLSLSDTKGEDVIGSLVIRGVEVKDVTETEDYVQYSYKGRKFYLCKETGKTYRNIAGLRGAQRLREYWRQVRAGEREPPKKPESYRRRRDNKERANGLSIEGYIVPRTSGPVFDYIRKNMSNFGVGIIPEDWPSRPVGPTPREEIMELHRDMLRLVQEIYGDKWRILIRSIGMGQETVDYLEHPLLYKKRWARGDRSGGVDHVRRPTEEMVAHLRQITLLTLVHLYNIMETTREFEREIWVNLQRLHDIRILPGKAKKKYDQQVAAVMSNLGAMRSVPDPQNPAEMLLMPLRVRALFHYPDLQFDEAIERERAKLMPDYWSDKTRSSNVEEIHEMYEEEIDMSEERYYEKKQLHKRETDIRQAEESEWWERAEEYWAEKVKVAKERAREKKRKRQAAQKELAREFREEADRKRKEVRARRAAKDAASK